MHGSPAVGSERLKVKPVSLSASVPLSAAAAGGAAAGRTAAAAGSAFPSPCLHHPSPTPEQVSRRCEEPAFLPVKYQDVYHTCISADKVATEQKRILIRLYLCSASLEV